MPSLSLTEIKELLPHRFPFLFVDEVEDYEVGVRILGRKRFSSEDFFMQGGGEFIPETILVETAAQVGALLILKDPQNAGKIPYFMSIDAMTFHRRIRVGETVRIEGKVLKMRGSFGILHGRSFVGDELIAEGTVRFALADRPSGL